MTVSLTLHIAGELPAVPRMGWFGQMGRALRRMAQWRLLLAWWLVLTVPAVLVGLPVWQALSRQLDHSLLAPALARGIDPSLLAEALGWPRERLRVTFQSRFGKAKWLEPATEPTLETLAREGKQHVQVVCPGFSADCLETLEEIAQEGRAAFLAAGGQTFHYLPCLNDGAPGMAMLRTLLQRELQGWIP